jgi:hypothetical protein
MAKNTKTKTGQGCRKGCIKNRSQVFNEKTGVYMKRDETGRFLSGKRTPYKNVRKENKK